MREPLINKLIQLERFPGKGGWTYARINDIPQNKKGHFGIRKVSGFIDGYELKNCHLMPMGNGKLFLPVKAEIRKSIKKQEGDLVKIVLYSDEEAIDVAKDFMVCLEDEPEALQKFQSLPEKEQNKFFEWISSGKTEEEKVQRIGTAITHILSGHLIKQ